jgi:phosphoglycerol transferase
MSRTAVPDWNRHAGLLLCLALAGVFAWLLARNLGLNPAIFADEWYYSRMSRLMPLSEAVVPSYLYLWLFRGTLVCGDGFLDCVRIGNALFFVGGALLFYLVARHHMPRLLAVAVALAAMLAPANVYTALFMPEATYYFGFAALSWVALSPAAWTPMLRALAAGAVVGLMSLVKVHALFLMPALGLFLGANAWMDGGAGRLRRALAAAVAAPLVGLAVKFGLGYLLAGDAALDVFGSLYSGAASSSGKGSALRLLAPAFINLRGHLMALAVVASLPLAMLLHLALSRAARQQADGRLQRLQLWTFLMLGSSVGLTIAFTTSISALNPAEALRLHLRYYSFVLPLLLMLGACALARPAVPLPASARGAAWLVAAGLLGVLAFAVWRLPTYVISPIDAPELAGIGLQTGAGQVLAGLGAVTLILWARGSRHAASVFLFLAVPLLLFSGARAGNAYLEQLRPGWPADHGGRFAHANVPAAERNGITVAATGILDLMRAQFHIDAPDSGLLDLDRDAPIEDYQLPVRRKWLLVIGNHPLPAGITPWKAGPGYALVRLPGASGRWLGSFAMSQPFGGFVAAAQGLSYGESWGRWSDAGQVVLHFSQPLPREALVVMKAQAFGPNTALPFTMRVGEVARSFRVGPTPQEVSLRFTTDGARRSLAIDVPQPASPLELAGMGDARKLGIGIADIAVMDLDQTASAVP